MVSDLEKYIDDTKKQMDGLKVSAGPELFPIIKGKDGKPLTGGVLLKAQQDALDALVDKYIANPTSIKDNDERTFVEQMRGLQLKQVQQGNLYTEVTKIDKVTDEALNKALGGIGGVNFPDGKPIYSAADLYKAQSILQNFRTVVTTGYSATAMGPATISDIRTDAEGLSPFA